MTSAINVDITITHIACEDFPVWLGIKLIDRHGNRHAFEEKEPIILPGNEPIPKKFPITIRLKCELIKTFKDYVVISTAKPYGIASIEGKSSFEIPPTAIYDIKKTFREKSL